MTRINCIPPSELTSLHLLAEYREISRVSKLARPAPDAPASYTMGKGHVLFFYDKGEYLSRRFRELVREMRRRGYSPQFDTYRPHPPGLNNDWVPTLEAMAINRARIAERLKNKKSLI